MVQTETQNHNMNKTLLSLMQTIAARTVSEADLSILPRASAALGTDETRDRLVAALRAAISFQRRLVCVPLTLAVASFVMGAIFGFKLGDRPGTLAAFIAASGISCTGSLAWCTYVLRKLWQYELLAAVIPELGQRALTELTRSILKALGKDTPVEAS
jgi:hypothetical protein